MLHSVPAGSRNVHLDAFRGGSRPQPAPAAIVGRIVSTSRDFVVTPFDSGVRIAATAPSGLSMALERRGEFYGIMFDLVGIDGLGAVEAQALLRDGVNGGLRLKCSFKSGRIIAQHLERRVSGSQWAAIAGVDRSGWVNWGVSHTYRFNTARHPSATVDQVLSIS